MLKRIGRFVLEPFARVFRKFFDPRFYKLESELAKTTETLEAILIRDIAVRDAITLTHTRISNLQAYSQDAQVRDIAVRDAITLTHTHISNLQAESQDAQAKLDLTHTRISNLQAYSQDAQAKLDFLLSEISTIRPGGENLPRSTEQITDGDAELLNYAEGHLGFRSQAGLWFNPPDVVRYDRGSVELSAMTERSIEIPFVISIVTSHVESAASVLDVGCAESLLPFELASLGYRVTGIDLREYPMDHPNLTTVATPLEEWESDERFDVVVCLSSIEHFGLGTYGEEVADERLDHRAMQILLDRVEPDGLLVMTIPYGETHVTPVQRIYTREDIDVLLKGWAIDTFQVAVPAAQGWVIADEVPDPAPTADPPITRQVAFITAHPDV